MLALWTIGLLAPAVAIDPPLPAGCPDAQAIAAEIAQAGPGEGTSAPGQIRLALAPAGDRLEARLSLHRDGQAPTVRVLQGASTDCPALVSAVALTAALIREPIAPAEPPVAARPAPAPPTVARDTRRPTPRGDRALHLAAHATLGGLPGVGFALEAGARAGPRRARFGLAGRLQLGPPAQVEGGRVGGWLVAAVTSGCSAWRALDGCLILVTGYQALEGVDFAVNRATAGLYLAAGARVGWAWALGEGWRVGAIGEATAPLTRITLTASDRQVWQTPAVAGHLGLEIGWRF